MDTKSRKEQGSGEEEQRAAAAIPSEAHPTLESLGNDDYIHHRLIFAALERHSGDLKFKECDLGSALCSTKPEVADLDHPFVGNRHASVEIVGSCDGLICVVLDGPEIFLWNPSTGNAKRLPTFGVESDTCELHAESHKMSYGFGYDEMNDDHKVVGVSCELFVGGEYHVLAKIYSIRTNSWRRLGHFKYRICDECCYYLNGRLHWTAAGPGQLDAGQKILTLDLAYEMCEKIEQPDYGGNIFTWTLGILGGCLSLCASCRKPEIDIWVMKEYGVKKSWTKVLTIPHNLSRNLGGGGFMKPVFASFKDARFAFLYHAEYAADKQILVLCRRSNDLKTMVLEFSNLEDLNGAAVYVKSSVSPDFPHGIRKTKRL